MNSLDLDFLDQLDSSHLKIWYNKTVWYNVINQLTLLVTYI